MLSKGLMLIGDANDDPIAESAPRRGRPAWLQTLIAVPAAVLPLLTSFSCPVCVAAYAGLLSSLGLGFLLTDSVQRPLIVAFLIVAVASVGWAARRYKRIGPFVLVLVGSATIIAGRIVWSVAPILYIGVVCLVAGIVWNLILKRPRRKFVPLGIADTRSPSS
jgi:MerC mercury resistance protein